MRYALFLPAALRDAPQNAPCGSGLALRASIPEHLSSNHRHPDPARSQSGVASSYRVRGNRVDYQSANLSHHCTCAARPVDPTYRKVIRSVATVPHAQTLMGIAQGVVLTNSASSPSFERDARQHETYCGVCMTHSATPWRSGRLAMALGCTFPCCTAISVLGRDEYVLGLCHDSRQNKPWGPLPIGQQQPKQNEQGRQRKKQLPSHNTLEGRVPRHA